MKQFPLSKHRLLYAPGGVARASHGKARIVTSSSVAMTLLLFILSASSYAQTGTLGDPFPAPAQNAALHYQRGLLHLSKVSDTTLLDKPLWEVLPAPVHKKVPGDVVRLLGDARFAVSSATSGSRLANCNFGIDFSDDGAGSQLPHLEGMVQLGRLLTLRGAVSEAQGNWEEAAIIYFDGLRVGRHLTNQNTLLEAMAGMEVMRNNYEALARWATRCPSRLLVARAFGLLESIQAGLVNPSQVLAREASIMSLELEALRNAYPNGNWATRILLSYGLDLGGTPEEQRTRAIAACVKKGVPQTVFKDAKSFNTYFDQLESTTSRFVESLAACMSLPPQARMERGQALNQKYAALLKIVEADDLIDAAEIGQLFAEHEAELAVTRVALACCASKNKDKKYPKTLDTVATRFGGTVPDNPYDGSAMQYQTQNDQAEFSLTVPGQGGLTAVSFNVKSPSKPE